MQIKVFHGVLKHMLINYYEVLIIKQEKRELISFFLFLLSILLCIPILTSIII